MEGLKMVFGFGRKKKTTRKRVVKKKTTKRKAVKRKTVKKRTVKKKATKKKTTRGKKKAFGGYSIDFKGRTETMEEVFGKKPIGPSEMTKKIWQYVKRKRIAGKR